LHLAQTLEIKVVFKSLWRRDAFQSGGIYLKIEDTQKIILFESGQMLPVPRRRNIYFVRS